MDTFVLALRVLLSLAVVLGLLWVLQRRFSRGAAGSSGDVELTVLSRRNVSPKASVVVVETDGKRFLLGVTEQSVNVLHTSDAPEPAPAEEPAGAAAFARSLEAADTHDGAAPDTVPAPALYPVPGDRRARHRPPSPLAGSILSPDTWKQTAAALRQVSQK
ncbi:flagellar biosynthetic protein FliO [Arthrobacter sp. I2-34]|uniref:Flagellar protein n=1 Tax=Arthrobacter hankyongi TaxID=2904801 RepID=A0ABS9L4V7_9MICC|nr:flagellar biosynthetic protein FliO [Arthrobacter hankyongi]MCG2621665.1 flagellar biosynthetic protein FliO [Arthrobacter hankyongi]